MYPPRYECTADGVFVQVHYRKPTDPEWRELLDFLLARKGTVRAVLVLAHGDTTPTSKQRANLAAVVKQLRPRVPFAMLTDSAIARTILTAINWLVNKQHESRVFSPLELDVALAFLGLNQSERDNARALLRKLDEVEPGRAASR